MDYTLRPLDSYYNIYDEIRKFFKGKKCSCSNSVALFDFLANVQK